MASQIAHNLRLISNLQYGLSEHPIASPCCEEELASLFSDGRAAKHGFLPIKAILSCAAYTASCVYDTTFLIQIFVTCQKLWYWWLFLKLKRSHLWFYSRSSNREVRQMPCSGKEIMSNFQTLLIA